MPYVLSWPKMPHTHLVAWFFAALLLVGSGPALGQDATRKPNVVLIVADDFGYECVGANGGTSYQTPHLDRLATNGVRFEHCHAQPLCTPTRVQLMTGQYNVRNYTRFGHLDPSQKTFGNLFRDAGYATCIVGKWQLGQEKNLPRHFGFDEALLWQHTRRPPRYANPGLELNGKELDFTKGEYGPDLVNTHAREFIARNKDRPFFLYYPMMLTHNPFQPTPESPNWNPRAFGEQVNQSPQHFAHMVAYMDKLVGRLIAELDKQGLREKTLVLFTGDNGTNVNITSRLGERTVRGGKGSTRLTGTHVPLLASWPGTLAGNRVCRDLVDSTDFLPTICEAAGLRVPAGHHVDGQSFFPQLRAEPGKPREWVYCWYARNGGATAQQEFAMNHRFKLYRNGNLFDLSQDHEEQQPLSSTRQPAEAAAARRLLQTALDQFVKARPAGIQSQAGKPGKAKG